jgi:hypothetical protein
MRAEPRCNCQTRIIGRRLLLCAVALTSTLLLSAPSAIAATVGQAVVPASSCTAPVSYAQTAVAGGTSYTVPSSGVLTSFSTRAYSLSAGPTMKLVVFRAAGAGNYLVVGVSNVALTLPTTVPGADIVTPITPIPVQAGDVIGFHISASGVQCAAFGSAGDSVVGAAGGEPAPGSTIALSGAFTFRLSIAANLASGSTCDTPPAPVGCWRFDELTGTTAFDSSAFANNGTYLAGPTLGAPGVFATAVLLDGVDDVVRVPDSASLDVGASFSAEGWIKRSSATKSHAMMNKGDRGLQLTVMAASSANQVYLRKANVTTIARSTAAVAADGSYHQVVATVNGANSARIYIDGVEAGTVQVGTVQLIQDTAFPLQFGDGASTPATYDQFALYDGVLTPEQVAEHFAAGPGH